MYCVDRSRRMTLLFAVGLCKMAARKATFERRARLLMFLGVFPMWKRTEGNPTGYKPRPKGAKCTPDTCQVVPLLPLSSLRDCAIACGFGVAT